LEEIKMKIVVLDGYTLNPGDLNWEGLERLGELIVYERTSGGDPEIVKAIGNADVVFTNKTPLTEKILNGVPTVKYIGVLATGYNVVDVAAAKRRGIIVTNIPSYATDSVAQFTFALLLEICHHIGAHNESVKKGQWAACADYCYWNSPLVELAGKKLGIIGFGRIGQATARIARSFGMKLLVYDTIKIQESEDENLIYTDLDELLKLADVISLHCPLTESTRGIINKDTISIMKDGIIIINTSRGQLVVEEDLKDALNNGKVAGAAVDVVSTEPIDEHNPLLKADNCIITPHIAWAPRAARERLMNTAVENLQAFLNGSPVNVVSN
jgi:glycerate dehydrogenase